MAKYAIKSATVTFGSTTYVCYAAPSGKAESREAVDVTSTTDTIKQFIPGALKEQDEITLTLASQGANDLTVDTAPASLSIAVVLSQGSGEDVTATVSYNKAIITKVSPVTVEGSGDRKASYDVTFRPDGTTAG